ncbi:hypothetical protein OIU85_010623, partial [Salix viminalis]
MLRPPGLDYDGSSSSNSDSSSHYGSPVLATSELKARLTSPVSSSPAVAVGPSEIPAASLLAAMDSGPVMQVAGNNVLVSEEAASLENSFGLAASLDVVWPKDPMAFEASTFAHARQPMPNSRIRQPDPMVETASADGWQPVPRKHTSNRQSKSGSGNPQNLALGTASVASKGKMVEAVGNESVDNGLLASGNMAAGSSLVEAVDNASVGTGLKDLSMGCAGLDGKPIGVAPQASAAAVLGPGLRAASK